MTHFIPFLFLSQNLRRIHLHDLAYLTGDDGSNEANHYHNTQDDRESRIDFYHFEHLTQNDMEQQHGYHRKYHGDERNHQLGSSEEFGNILCQSTIYFADSHLLLAGLRIQHHRTEDAYQADNQTHDSQDPRNILQYFQR